MSSMKGPLLPVSVRRKPIIKQYLAICALATVISLYGCSFMLNGSRLLVHVPLRQQEILDKCAALKVPAGPPEDFYTRETSDRYQAGTTATLIRNATIFTGARNGTEVVYGDVLLNGGIVKALGYIPPRLLALANDVEVVDAGGRWVTPGLVDLHSHLGVYSAPVLTGSLSVNSHNGPILPWLRSIDGFNTHDDAFQLSISGGITSAQILPGSGNAIGGQAFFVKLRKTLERSPSSMVIEPPHNLNGSELDHLSPPRWRHMKQACGENLRRYGNRMDSAWSFRSAYDEARKVKVAQDEFCAKAESGLWDSLKDQEYLDDLKWEMLVDVLRGRVKISNHCYEAVDFDDLIRISNEFKFHIASFHHASEAWIVPDLLKRTYGGPPAVAIFSNHAGYKRESYRGSEYAARVLADNGLPVIMKSDHPVTNSRHLLYEAQQAHYYGLPAHLALASVTSTPATAAGLSHRIGILREGADADAVLWDTHPLQLGATPVKVWIDGLLEVPMKIEKGGSSKRVVVGKGKESEAWQKVPDVPDWDEERAEAIKWEGLPPLNCEKHQGIVVFDNVAELWTEGSDGQIEDQLAAAGRPASGVVVVKAGQVICAGSSQSCTTVSSGSSAHVDLHGGSISPGLLSFGSGLGTQEIQGEASTGPGESFDALSKDVPKIIGDVGALAKASDALLFQTRDALKSYRSGVTYATTSLSAHSGPIAGLSATFRTGALHAAEKGALIQDVTALHVSVRRKLSDQAASISSTIATLRRLLLEGESKETETGKWFDQAAKGVIPFIIYVSNADIMATLLRLKAEVEETRGTNMKMVFSGASEAHILAEEIANAKVGVILTPARPFPGAWDGRRILAGPPITNETSVVKLTRHGVIVGLGVEETDYARNARFDLTWAGLESNGEISQRQAYALCSSNLKKLLGVQGDGDSDLVAYDGGSLFDLSSKAVAVLSSEKQTVELFH